MVLIPVGLVWRFAHLGLPQFWFKYGGSVLWAAMIYWVIAAVLPGWRPWRVGIVAAGVACAVEGLKLYHAGWLEAFRMTLAGKVLIGKYFSGWDVVAYLLAIGVVVAVDQRCGVIGQAECE
jgi:beta-N-acetylhexosaminidase